MKSRTDSRAQAAQKPRYAAIIGTGAYLPERVVTNFDLEKMVDTSDEWIRQRTGIAERRIADDDVATSDLSVHAARWAIKNAQIDPIDIDMILVATVTPDTFFHQRLAMSRKASVQRTHLQWIYQPHAPASFMALI